MTTTPYTLTWTQEDINARTYLEYLVSLKAGVKPDDHYPECGQWNSVVVICLNAFKKGAPADAFLKTLIASEKFPGLSELLTTVRPDAPTSEMSNGHKPTQDETEAPSIQVRSNEVDIPPLPENIRLPEELSRGACAWLDNYIEYSREISPEGYEDFHEACGLWLLSTIAGRRVKIPFRRGQYTPLMIVLVARGGLYIKSDTAEVAIDVLRAANLHWLLGSDETTPQKLLTDMSGPIPKNYGSLDEVKQYRIRQRLAMSAQRGWYYDEFGQLIRAMLKQNGIMQDFKGLLLKLDKCAESYEYATQSRGTELIEKPYLALLGTMTPPDIKNLAKAGSDLWSDGLWDRFAWVCPPPGTALDKPFVLGEMPVPYTLYKPLKDWHDRLGIPNVVIDEKRDEKERITDYTATRGELPETTIELPPDVYNAWVTYRSALKSIAKQLTTEDLDGSYQRLSIKAIRIAALFASLENGNVIELKHWCKAQEISERWRKSLHELYRQVNAEDSSPTSAKKLEDDILRIVRKLEKEKQPPTIKEIRDYLKRVDLGRLKQGVHDLVRARLLAEDTLGKSPRYTTVEETL
jgi:Protein of unknown function (DUF3987)